jgi:hypothetical protein
MRTTIDIPDQTHRAMKILAAETGTTVRQLVLEGLEMVVKQATVASRMPSTSSPETLALGNETIGNHIDFP